MKKYLLKIKNYLENKNLLPNYSEETILFITLSVIFIFIIDSVFRKSFIDFFINTEGGFNGIKVKLVIIGGFLFTLYTTFFSYFKTEYQKNIMFSSVLFVNIVVNFSLLSNLNNNGTMKLLNILLYMNFAILLLMVLFKYLSILDTSALKNRSLNSRNTIYGGLILLLLIIIQKYFFNLHWEALLTGSVWYVTLFNKKIVSYFPALNKKKDIDIQNIEDLIEGVIQNYPGYGLLIYSQNSKRVVRLPFNLEKEDQINEFIKRELQQEDRTKPVAIGIFGQVKYGSFLTGKKYIPAVIIDVFLNKKNKGYQFAKTFSNETDSLLQNKIIYLGRTENLFML